MALHFTEEYDTCITFLYGVEVRVSYVVYSCWCTLILRIRTVLSESHRIKDML